MIKIKKDLILILIGICISVAAIVFFLTQFNFNEVFQLILEAKYIFIIAGFFVYFFNFVALAFRWYFLLKAANKPIPFFACYRINLIGFFSNYVLPLRMGEVIKAYLTANRITTEKSMAISIVIIERLFDFIAVLLLFLLSSYLQKFSIKQNPLLIAPLVIAVIAVVIGFIFIFFPDFFLRLYKKLFFWIPFKQKIDNVVNSIFNGLKSIQSIQKLLIGLFFTLCYWFCIYFGYYFVLLALNLNLPWYSVIFLMVITSIGVSVPSAPGFIGTMEFSIAEAFKILNLPIDFAHACALIYHFTQFVFVFSFGVLALMGEHISFKELKSIKSDQKTPMNN